MVAGPRNHLDLQGPLSVRGGGPLFAQIAELQDARELAVQVDAEFLIDGSEDDLVHQRADDLEGLGLGISYFQEDGPGSAWPNDYLPNVSKDQYTSPT